MVRLAREAGAEADQADDPGDDADLDPLGLEHRPLLDVQLEVGADLVDSARTRQRVEVEAELGHRLAQADAVGVAALAEVAQVLAHERAAAEERRAEARPPRP